MACACASSVNCAFHFRVAHLTACYGGPQVTSALEAFDTLIAKCNDIIDIRIEANLLTVRVPLPAHCLPRCD